ncbi:MAG: hypothetical protein QXR73_03655, partial [Candidatus Micrarchaeaceae archaeon]
MKNDKKLMAFALYAIIIAVVLAYSSYFYVPHAVQNNLQHNVYLNNITVKYTYASHLESTLNALAVPIMTQYPYCDECGTNVSCPIGDCVVSHFDCPGTNQRANICKTTSTS